VPITPTCFFRRGGDGAERAGVDHVQYRHRGEVFHTLRGHRCHGVAGDDQQLDPFGEQEFRDLGGVMGDGFDRLHAIRHARGVAKIDDVLERQTLHQGAHDGEAAYAGVEYADGVAGIGMRHKVSVKNNALFWGFRSFRSSWSLVQ